MNQQAPAAPLPLTDSKNTVIGPFVLNNDHEYAWPVTITVPTLDPHCPATQQLVAVFRHIVPEERGSKFEAHARRWIDAQEARNAELAKPVHDPAVLHNAERVPSAELAMLREVVVRIASGVVDANGNDISKQSGVLELLLRNQWARGALWRAYMDSVKYRNSLGN
jgi:hypothetical protein